MKYTYGHRSCLAIGDVSTDSPFVQGAWRPPTAPVARPGSIQVSHALYVGSGFQRPYVGSNFNGHYAGTGVMDVVKDPGSMDPM